MSPRNDAPVVLFAYAAHRPWKAAFEAAVRQAAWRGLDLVIVNAHHAERQAAAALATPDQLRALVERARAEGVTARVEQPGGPDVPTMILNRAEGLPAEVVVLATRPRSAVGKLILGSTAQQVLMDADCEVLLVRGRGRTGRRTTGRDSPA